jgi:hypothetical protein
MAVLQGPVGAIEAQAAFDENINAGRAQCMACDWIQQILKASSGG